VEGSTALLRAEHSGTGDGRVYRVVFTADDGDGGVCSGAVLMGALVAVLLELDRRRKASRPVRKA
jgi:hypothetical protein